jgi:hypothetical protein
MVEVFSTDVDDADMAREILAAIHETFNEYRANFDLDDCDRILRIQCEGGCVENAGIIYLLKQFNCSARPLEDSVPEKLIVKDRLSHLIQVF